jgi:xanthine dehydrogenase accessory factor
LRILADIFDKIMNDFQRIVQTLDRRAPEKRLLEKRDDICALATVVATKGSTYRHTGARMLVFSDGTMIGAISGGCLESDVFERSLQVIETGQAQYIVYDGTKSEASNDGLLGNIMGLEMGCNGLTEVLIERIDGAEDGFIGSVRDALRQRSKVCAATVYDVSDASVLEGLHAIVQENGDILDNFGDHPFAEAVRTMVLDWDAFTMKTREEQNIVVEQDGITAQLLLEPIPLPKELIVFGAGYDTLPLLDYASMLGWRVTVLDVRPLLLNAERLAKADTIKHFHTETIPETVAELGITNETALVVMTHHLERDAEILRCVMPYKPLYCGLLGPKERFAKIQYLWNERGYMLAEKLVKNIHTPIGLDIGSETAEEVALAIVAEVQAAFNKREGGSLKARKQRIHEG